MNRKDIVLKTIRGEETAYTPYNFDLTMKMTDRLGQYYGLDGNDVEEFIGNHFLYLSFEGPDGKNNGYRNNTENEVYYDEFGVKWDVSGNYDIGDWGMVDTAVKNLDFSNYHFPDGTEGGRFNNAIELMKKFPGRLNVMPIKGPFTAGWNITGMEDFLMGMVLEEKVIELVLERMTNYIVNIVQALPEGVDAVRILDDWGTQSGLIFSKAMWKKYMHKYYEIIGDTIRSKGLVFIHHSCGNTTELFPYFIELGIDVYDPMQPESLDIIYIKREFGKNITLYGGIGSQSTIPLGNPKSVLSEAKKTHAILGDCGRYIMGPSGGISTEAPIDNVVALVHYCKEQAKL